LPRPCGFCKFLGGLVLCAKWISMSQVTQPLRCHIHHPYPGLTGQAPRDGFSTKSPNVSPMRRGTPSLRLKEAPIGVSSNAG
jgi:hypothetical protein